MSSRSFIPRKLSKQFEEIFSLPPNDLHNEFLTSLYKIFTRPLKRMPLAVIIPVAILLSLFAYLLLGQLIIQLVSLLQHGF